MTYVCVKLTSKNRPECHIFLPASELKPSHLSGGDMQFGWGETCACLVLYEGVLYEISGIGVGHSLGGDSQFAAYDFGFHSSQVEKRGLPVGTLEVVIRSEKSPSEWGAAWKKSIVSSVEYEPYEPKVLGFEAI